VGDFEDRVIIVTGAASFLGEAIGAVVIEGGGRVILADRDADHGGAVAERLGERATFVPTDVASDADLDRLVETAIDRFGRLDGVVGASANFDDEKLASDRELWQRVLDVNVASAAVLTTKAAAAMGPGGSIVHVASVSGHVSQPEHVVYNVSKAGLLMLVKSAANHLAPQRIRVNAVSPGWMWSRNIERRYGTRERADAWPPSSSRSAGWPSRARLPRRSASSCRIARRSSLARRSWSTAAIRPWGLRRSASHSTRSGRSSSARARRVPRDSPGRSRPVLRARRLSGSRPWSRPRSASRR
jgi:NAD(P)-dependent dehydrogenase (short-subunit alcohol dehydrogenase family)